MDSPRLSVEASTLSCLARWAIHALRDVVRNAWIAHRAKQDSVEASSLKRGESIGRHHGPLPQVALRTPISLLDVKMKAAIDQGETRKGLYTLCNDLWPNAISRHDG